MSKTHLLPIHCPWCGRLNDRAFAPGQQGPDLPPEDGNVVMCFGCGQLAIIDTRLKTNTRAPTDEEADELADDPYIRRMTWTWRRAMQTKGNA